MQMTLTARKEVIRQLIERRRRCLRRHRVSRQSVPFDARPGARYSPAEADPLRLLA